MLVKFKCLGIRVQLKRAIDMFQLTKQEVLSRGRHQRAANSENLDEVIFPVSYREIISSVFLLYLTTGLSDEKRFISFYCLDFLLKNGMRQRKLLEVVDKKQ